MTAFDPKEITLLFKRELATLRADKIYIEQLGEAMGNPRRTMNYKLSKHNWHVDEFVKGCNFLKLDPIEELDTIIKKSNKA